MNKSYRSPSTHEEIAAPTQESSLSEPDIALFWLCEHADDGEQWIECR